MQPHGQACFKQLHDEATVTSCCWVIRHLSHKFHSRGEICYCIFGIIHTRCIKGVGDVLV